MNRFELYRFRHPDGRAKEWAYRELGNGDAEIRWGPQRQLAHAQIKPLRLTLERARAKVRQGYSYVGSVWLDGLGRPSVAPFPTVPATRASHHTAVDLSALLGSHDDSFYF